MERTISLSMKILVYATLVSTELKANLLGAIKKELWVQEIWFMYRLEALPWVLIMGIKCCLLMALKLIVHQTLIQLSKIEKRGRKLEWKTESWNLKCQTLCYHPLIQNQETILEFNQKWVTIAPVMLIEGIKQLVVSNWGQCDFQRTNVSRIRNILTNWKHRINTWNWIQPLKKLIWNTSWESTRFFVWCWLRIDAKDWGRKFYK